MSSIASTEESSSDESSLCKLADDSFTEELSGSQSGREFESAHNQTSKSWFKTAVAIGFIILGVLVLLGLGGYGTAGLLQAHEIVSWQWLVSTVETLGNPGLWTLAVGGGVLGITLIAWGAYKLMQRETASKSEAMPQFGDYFDEIGLSKATYLDLEKDTFTIHQFGTWKMDTFIPEDREDRYALIRKEKGTVECTQRITKERADYSVNWFINTGICLSAGFWIEWLNESNLLDFPASFLSYFDKVKPLHFTAVENGTLGKRRIVLRTGDGHLKSTEWIEEKLFQVRRGTLVESGYQDEWCKFGNRFTEVGTTYQEFDWLGEGRFTSVNNESGSYYVIRDPKYSTFPQCTRHLAPGEDEFLIPFLGAKFSFQAAPSS